MKVEMLVQMEFEAKSIHIQVPVRYEEEDIPNNFPGRSGDTWSAKVDVDTGQIENWPNGVEHHLYMKVCDEGVYRLYSADGTEIAKRENYVPVCLPNEYGDYLDLRIAADGKISNWDTNAEEIAESFGEEA